MENELKQLGLSTAEAKIYLALLELGQTTAGPLVKRTALHRQVVYDTVEKLKARDLVTETVRSNRKNWQAAAPTRILDDIKRKELLAEKLLPGLLATQNVSNRKQEVQVYEGDEGFKALHKTHLRDIAPNSTLYVMGGSAPRLWIPTMRKVKYFKTHEKERMKKNMAIKLIFFEKERASTEEAYRKYYLQQPPEQRRQFRFLPDEFENPVGIQVWPQNVAFIIYGEPIFIIDIKNPELVRSFIKYFEIMWNMATPLKHIEK